MAGIQQAFNQILGSSAGVGALNRGIKALEASTPEAAAEFAAKQAEERASKYMDTSPKKPYGNRTIQEMSAEREHERGIVEKLEEAYKANPTEEREENLREWQHSLFGTEQDIEEAKEQATFERAMKRAKTIRDQKEALKIRKSILEGTPAEYLLGGNK